MNTTKIYYAQLNVSNFFTVETITNLIEKISYIGKDAYYNTETKTIDIELDEENYLLAESKIRTELKNWIQGLDADKESINIICDNIDYIFNITQITIDNKIIAKLYLY